jgi:signal transduction histidine kinase
VWWPLRNQILVPLLAILTAAVTATAAVAASLAARRSERQTLDQLRRVIDTLGRSSFPYTPAVLEKMRGLSGAHFIAYDGRGRATASTLPGTAMPEGPSTIPGSRGLDALGERPTLSVGGVRYLAARLRTSAGASGVETLLVLYPEASWRQARREAALPPLVVGVGAIALSAIATGWVAHRLGVRLRSVQRQVSAIADGDFRQLAIEGPRDEVQDLVAAVNRMSAQLRQMQQEIRRSERAALIAQFAAGLAHQLRNAVAGARMAVQLHARRCPAEGADRSLDVALRQLSLTEEQVKGLLSLGRRERRPPNPCDVGQLVDEVAALVGPAGQHAGVAIRTGLRDGPLPVVADVDALRAAVLNLALNAVEAAGAGGEVGLDASAEDGEVRVEVSDTGPGPPRELAEALFEPFVTGKTAGVGLGLALARQVASDHGGGLSWTRDDRTTRFLLTLPRTPANREG